MGKQLGGSTAKVDWSFISGFFDGEGAIHVSAFRGSMILALKVTICQKSVEVLEAIRALLAVSGIFSVIRKFANGIYCLEIIRIRDVTQFFYSVRCVVKGRQVAAAIQYLDSKVSGNAFLQVLDDEHTSHRRKSSPLRFLGPNFPLTRSEALAQSKIISAKARVEGNRKAFLRRLERRVLSLPITFRVRDIERVIGVTKPRAQVIGNLFVREGFARSHYERAPHRLGHATKVFERLERPKLISSSFLPLADAKAPLSERHESEGREGSPSSGVGP